MPSAYTTPATPVTQAQVTVPDDGSAATAHVTATGAWPDLIQGAAPVTLTVQDGATVQFGPFTPAGEGGITRQPDAPAETTSTLKLHDEATLPELAPDFAPDDEGTTLPLNTITAAVLATVPHDLRTPLPDGVVTANTRPTTEGKTAREWLTDVYGPLGYRAVWTPDLVLVIDRPAPRGDTTYGVPSADSRTVNLQAAPSSITVTGGTPPAKRAGVTGPAQPTDPDTGQPTAPAPPEYTSTQRSVTLTWSNPEGEQAPAGVTITRDGQPATTLPGGVTSWTDTNLQPGTSYRYAITTTSTAGTPGATLTVDARTKTPQDGPPAPVTDVNAFAVTATTIGLTWRTDEDADLAPPTAWRVTYAAQPAGTPDTLTVDAPTVTLTGLAETTTYQVTLTPLNGAQEGEGTTVNYTTTAPIPGSVTNLAVSANATTASATWSPAPGSALTEVQLLKAGAVLRTVRTPASTLTLDALTRGSTYALRARGLAGEAPGDPAGEWTQVAFTTLNQPEEGPAPTFETMDTAVTTLLTATETPDGPGVATVTLTKRQGRLVRTVTRVTGPVKTRIVDAKDTAKTATLADALISVTTTDHEYNALPWEVVTDTHTEVVGYGWTTTAMTTWGEVMRRTTHTTWTYGADGLLQSESLSEVRPNMHVDAAGNYAATGTVPPDTVQCVVTHQPTGGGYYAHITTELARVVTATYDATTSLVSGFTTKEYPSVRAVVNDQPPPAATLPAAWQAQWGAVLPPLTQVPSEAREPGWSDPDAPEPEEEEALTVEPTPPVVTLTVPGGRGAPQALTWPYALSPAALLPVARMMADTLRPAVTITREYPYAVPVTLLDPGVRAYEVDVAQDGGVLNVTTRVTTRAPLEALA